MPMLAKSYFLTKIWGRLLGLFHKMGGKNPYAGGGWIGNDTVWRMTLDLNRILLYAHKDGTIRRERPPRQYLTVVDGIVAAEGEGPMNVKARPAGVLLAAGNPLVCDLAASRIMGFDPENLKLIPGGLQEHDLPISPVTGPYEIDLAAFQMHHSSQWTATPWEELPDYHFTPPTGWEGLVAAKHAKRAGEGGCHG
jgi:hypothetical protein